MSVGSGKFDYLEFRTEFAVKLTHKIPIMTVPIDPTDYDKNLRLRRGSFAIVEI